MLHVFRQHTGAIKEWQYVALHKTLTLYNVQNCTQGYFLTVTWNY